MSESKTWPELVRETMPRFQEIATENNLVKWSEESQFAIQALQKNEGLSKCAIHTVQNSIINVAAVGLTLNPADGYAYLVPEYNKKLNGNECHLRISFKGLIKIACESGSIKWVKAEIVKESDDFTYKGPAVTPEHNMNPFKERGNPIGVYCIAKTAENDILVDTMDWAEVQKIRSCAKFDSVWAQWTEEMAKKAIIKRAAKQWPKCEKTSRLNQAIKVINDSEGNDIVDYQIIANSIIEGIQSDDMLKVAEEWIELSPSEQDRLWIAKTKGGFFTQDEKSYIRKAIAKAHEPQIIDHQED